MKFWITKNSEVAVNEQIVAQVTIALASGDLSVGDKLPSRAEMARRFGIHANTVGAAYQRLVDDGLVEFQKGKGYFVTAREAERTATLESIVHDAVRRARQLGYNKEDIVRKLRGTKRVDARELLLIESDEGLREILMYELLQRVNAPISAVSFEDFASARAPDGFQLIAMSDEKPKVDPLLPDGRSCFYIRNGSVAEALKGQIRPAEGETVAVVSGWNDFLTFGRLLLLAAKIEAGNLIVRSTNDEGWRSAIAGASLVISDALTATQLPPTDRNRTFNIVSEDSINELLAAFQTPS